MLNLETFNPSKDTIDTCGTNGKKYIKKNGKLRKVWYGIKTRCYNTNDHNYTRYGAKGIEMCDRWKNSFDKFYEDMGDRPDAPEGSVKPMCIERIDNDGDYEPSNCRWATMKEQARNTRRNNLVTYLGETKPLIQWCEELNIPYGRTKARLCRGWDSANAFELEQQKNQFC